MEPVVLNAYHAIDGIGEIVTYVLVGLMAIVWIWIMFKYLNTSDLNE